VSTPTPDAWDVARSRVTALIARRAAVLDETAAAWARFAHGQGWTRADLDALWEGLTEDVVRRYSRESPPPRADAKTVCEDVLATMAAIRDRILKELTP
jgi:hypothetical protein